MRSDAGPSIAMRGDLLVDVVHTDEGITHYEYDENGHISSVTDQNGSCYLENEYDVKGRGHPSELFQASVPDLYL